jgi:hypothetical protein
MDAIGNQFYPVVTERACFAFSPTTDTKTFIIMEVLQEIALFAASTMCGGH